MRDRAVSGGDAASISPNSELHIIRFHSSITSSHYHTSNRLLWFSSFFSQTYQKIRPNIQMVHWNLNKIQIHITHGLYISTKIISEKNSTILFPVPLEMVAIFMGAKEHEAWKLKKKWFDEILLKLWKRNDPRRYLGKESTTQKKIYTCSLLNVWAV